MIDTGTSSAAVGVKGRSLLFMTLVLVCLILVTGCSPMSGGLYSRRQPIMPLSGNAPLPPVYDDTIGTLPGPDEPRLVQEARLVKEAPAVEPAPAPVVVYTQELQPERQPVATPVAPSVPDPAPIIAVLPPEPAPPPPVPRQARREDPDVQQIGIQIGSFSIEANADNGWPVFAGRYPRLLSKLHPVIVEVDLGEKGTFYRLMAVGAKSVAAAQAICDQLMVIGHDWCAVREL